MTTEHAPAAWISNTRMVHRTPAWADAATNAQVQELRPALTPLEMCPTCFPLLSDWGDFVQEAKRG